MDQARAAALKTLASRILERDPGFPIEGFRELVRVGEVRVALENLCDNLAELGVGLDARTVALLVAQCRSIQMDERYWKDLEASINWPRLMAQIRALAEDNRDSLSGPQLETVLGFLDVCECALALDSFCDAMFENECIASPETRAIVGRIAKELGMDSTGEYERLLGGPG